MEYVRIPASSHNSRAPQVVGGGGEDPRKPPMGRPSRAHEADEVHNPKRLRNAAKKARRKERRLRRLIDGSDDSDAEAEPAAPICIIDFEILVSIYLDRLSLSRSSSFSYVLFQIRTGGASKLRLMGADERRRMDQSVRTR